MLLDSKPMGLSEIKALPSVPFSDRKSFPDSKGVYFVVDGEEAVYIGMTGGDFRTRWSTHHRFKDIEASCNTPEIFFLSLDLTDKEILDIEIALIRAHAPRLNGAPCEEGKRITFDADKLSIQWDQIAEVIGVSRVHWGLLSSAQQALAAIEYGMDAAEKTARKRAASQC